MNVIAFVGMPGSGKSLLSEHFATKGYPKIRFGEMIIREVTRRSLPITPQNEQMVREELRNQRGMDVLAQMALPLIEKNLKTNSAVIIDGLYSFSEYKTLKEKFGKNLILIAVFTPKILRYQRLASRIERPLSASEAEQRDFMEIEKIEKAGPIAIADFMLINDSTKQQLKEKAEDILSTLIT